VHLRPVLVELAAVPSRGLYVTEPELADLNAAVAKWSAVNTASRPYLITARSSPFAATTGFAALRSLAALAGRLSGTAAAVSGARTLIVFMITKEKRAHRVIFFRDHAEHRG
jgi:hypothetical protein